MRLFFLLLIISLFSISFATTIIHNGQERYYTAHRGNMDQYAENTLEGMWGSLAQGFNALEIDLQVTEDRRLILWHDYFSIRVELYNTNCWWTAPAWSTYAEIDRDCYTKKDGKKYRIRTLNDVLTSGILEDSRLEFIFLDIKVPPRGLYKRDIVKEVALATENELKDIDHDLFMQKIGLNLRSIELIKLLKKRGNLPYTPNYIHYGTTGAEPLTKYESWKAKLREHEMEWVSINLSLSHLISPFIKKKSEARNTIKKAHHDGFKVNCWSMNSKKAVLAALDLGCDSIVGNKAEYYPQS